MEAEKIFHQLNEESKDNKIKELTEKVSKLDLLNKQLEAEKIFHQLDEKSKDIKIIELKEKALKLELLNKQLEAEKKKEAYKKRYYFDKCKKMEDSFNTEKLTASSVHTTSPTYFFSPHSPSQSPPLCQPTPPPIQIIDSYWN